MTVFRKNIAKSRKQIRKETRLAKKAKKHEYFSNRGVKKVVSKTSKDNPADNTLQAIITRAANDSPPPSKKLQKAKTKKKKSVSSLQEELPMELIENDRQIKELDKEMEKERLMKLKEDNEAEFKEIRRLQKRLKLKKRSDKSISNFFAEDGLDYLLDVCDQKKLKRVVETEKNFKEDDSDFDDDYAKVVGMPLKRKKKRKPKVDSGSDSDDEPEELTPRKGGYGKIQKIINTSTRETKTDKQEKTLESENDDYSEDEITDFYCELEGVGDESDSSSSVDNKKQKTKRKSEERPVKGNKGKIDSKIDRNKSVKDKKTNPSRVFASESVADSSDVEMESFCSGSDNEERYSNVTKRKEYIIVNELKNKGGKVLQKKKVKVAKSGLVFPQIENNFSDDIISSLGSGSDFDGTEETAIEFRTELIENDRQIKEQREILMKLKEENEAELKENRRLKKLLKLTKRSDKSISNFFAEDDLDYILDVCDQKKLKGIVETEKNFKEDDSDFDDDYAKVVGMPSKRKKKIKPKADSGSDSDDEPEEWTSRKGGYGKIQKIITTSTRETKMDKQEITLESDNDNDSEGEISDFDSELDGVGDESDSSSAVGNKEQKSKRKSEERPVKGNKGKIDSKIDRNISVKDKKTNPSRVFASESEADSSDVEMESFCSGSDNEERHSNVTKRKEGIIVKELKNEGGKVLQKKKVKVAKGGLAFSQIENNFSDDIISSLGSGSDFDGTEETAIEFRMELIENDRQIKELDKKMQKEMLMELKEDIEAELKEIRLEKLLKLRKRSGKSLSKFLAEEDLDHLLDVSDQKKLILKQIQRLEKRLKLKKRSDKSISNFFAEDDLDYLLDVCDLKKLKWVVETEKNFKEDDSDDDDNAKVVGMPLKRKKKRKPKVNSGSDSDDEPEELTSRKGGYGKIQKIINTSTRESKTDKQEKSLESENDNDSEGEISDFDSELESVGDESDSSSAVDNKEQKSKRKSEERPVKGNKGKIDSKTDRSRSVKDKKTNPSRVFASESEADSSDVEMESSCSGSDNEERHSNVTKRKEGIIVKELKNEGGKVIQKKKVIVAKGGLASAQIKNNFSDSDVSSLASGCDFDGTAAEPKKVTKGKKLKTMTPNQKGTAAAIIDADENPSSEDEVSSLENESGIIDTKKTVKATAKKDRKKVNVEPPIKKARNIADEQPELDKVENPSSEDEVSSLGDDPEDTDSGNNQSNELWEDIYGRTRDKAGNVMSAYQPPQLRKKEKENADSEKVARLKKQMKGLLNRLAEDNMVSISSQLENLYMSHSRNEMNETLWSLLRESLISEPMAPERLVAEHAMLIAILGANIGSEVSAYCLQRCVTEWHQLLEDGPCVEDKRTNNVLLLLSYLYHFIE